MWYWKLSLSSFSSTLRSVLFCNICIPPQKQNIFWRHFWKIIPTMTSKNLVLCWVKFLNICLHLVIIDQQIILLFVCNWKLTSLVLSSAFFYNNKWSNIFHLILLILVFRLKPRKNHSLKAQSVPIVRSPFGDC